MAFWAAPDQPAQAVTAAGRARASGDGGRLGADARHARHEARGETCGHRADDCSGGAALIRLGKLTTDARLLGPVFGAPSYRPMVAVLKAAFGEPLDTDERQHFDRL